MPLTVKKQILDDEGPKRPCDSRYTVSRQVRGTAENPMTRDEVREKCNGLFAPVLGSRRAGEAIEAIWGAERVEDVQSLRPLLRA